MNRVLHKIIFFVFVAILLHLSGDESEAAIYKWKDESGKIYFTDDQNRVPEEFREEYYKKKLPPTIPKSKSPIKTEEKSDQEKEVPENEEPKKNEGLTASEKTAAEAVISFFEEDIPRYDEIYKILLGTGIMVFENGKHFRERQ